ncbi:MAG: exodeoxyribonuclease VII large subunit [Myxococcota bacterium]|nr:exodeoxyribonuclease VII large subunit [Myxococcota bacterium]
MSESARAEVPVYKVGDLMAGLRHLLEERVGRLWVVGEVSNLRRPGSGHVYFTLKDDVGQIRAALFRNTARRLPFEPEDGLEVLVYAEVTVYEPRGDLQLIVRHLEPRGEGALQLAFEQLRRRLEAEGLFDEARKRALPAVPRRLAVVASPTSAALRDVLQVTGRRCPGLPLLISPTRVQGPGAEREVAEALALAARAEQVDAVLLVRGGGSLEDLQAFNTEVVARAIVACPVPVVAGVGHEIDVTIADLAADLRAATPSAAAELAAPDGTHLRRVLQRDWQRLGRAASAQLVRREARLSRAREAVAMLAPATRLAGWRSRLDALVRALERAPATRLGSARARLEALGRALQRAAEARLSERPRVEALGRSLVAAGRGRVAGDRARLGEAAARLEALSPLAVLSRGYALVRRARDGAIVRRPDQVEVGERLAVRVAEADLEAVVEASRPLRDR